MYRVAFCVSTYHCVSKLYNMDFSKITHGSSSLIEMQTILIGLLSTFEFSIDPKLEFFRGLAGTVAPVLKGKETEGPQMPLKVRLRTAVRD